MKIVICGSMDFVNEMVNCKKSLSSEGHEVIIPQGARRKGLVPISQELLDEDRDDEYKYYFDEISLANAILVLNHEKKGIPGYIGTNTVLEMSFAYVLSKMIILFNKIPSLEDNLPSQDELMRMFPYVVLNDWQDKDIFRKKHISNIQQLKGRKARIQKRNRLDIYLNNFDNLEYIKECVL